VPDCLRIDHLPSKDHLLWRLQNTPLRRETFLFIRPVLSPEILRTQYESGEKHRRLPYMLLGPRHDDTPVLSLRFVLSPFYPNVFLSGDIALNVSAPFSSEYLDSVDFASANGFF